MTDYSHKDFTGQSLIDRDDMDGITISMSCFSHQVPDTHIFPETMTGVTFQYCNLDNCFIPDGNTIIECSQRRFISNADGDWLVDADNNIVGPLNG